MQKTIGIVVIHVVTYKWIIVFNTNSILEKSNLIHIYYTFIKNGYM